MNNKGDLKIMEWFMELNPIAQGLSATIFTWAITALGAALVFFFKTVDRRILNCMLGFGAGVMIAASFWSLLNPAIELCDNLGYSEIILPSIGFFSGGIFIILADKMMDKYSYCVITKRDETSVDSVACCQSTQDEYTKVAVADVPEVVKTAVEKAYAGQTIKEASVAEKDGAKTYKLVIATAEGTESTVTFNDKGEEVK